MTIVWASIYNDSETKVAEAHDFLSGSASLRTNEAGEWQMTLPAAADVEQHIERRGLVKFYSKLGQAGSDIYLGGGRIERVRRVMSGGTMTLEVSGSGKLRDLAEVLVMDEEGVYEMTFTTHTQQNSQEFDNGLEWDDGGNDKTVIPGDTSGDGGGRPFNEFTLTTADYLYVGYFTPFDRLQWNLDETTVNGNAATMTTFQYPAWDPNIAKHTWTSLTLTDGTETGGATFAQDGTMSWTMPTDWGPLNHANRTRYWVRMRPDALLDTVAVDDLTLRVQGPRATDDIDYLMTQHAPAGWTLDTTNYFDSTDNGVYYPRLHGVSLLYVLNTIATDTFEYFRYADSDEVEWLQDTNYDSGLLASNQGNPRLMATQTGVLVIMDIEQMDDASDYITRLYVEGAGEGDAAIDLSLATDINGSNQWTVNTSVLVNTSSSYVYVSGDSANGPHAFMKFSDIGSISGRNTGPVSNQLLQAAANELLKRSQTFYAYRIRVTGITDEIPVGEQIRVMWAGANSTGVYHDVNELLYINAVTYEFNPEGLTATLECANLRRKPLGEFDLWQRNLNLQPTVSNLPQPANFEKTVGGSFDWVERT